MSFHLSKASLLIPDGSDAESAWGRVTHLGIGAHADDLEFMALHGILAGYQNQHQAFGGVTCTDGGGSVNPAGVDLVKLRRSEQEEAARIGQYAVMLQLGYASAEAKNPKDRRLTDDLQQVFQSCHPRVVYTHNPADKHETHIAVMMRVIAALRKLPPERRPEKVLGCEVWRGLDWLMDEDKVALDVSTHPELANQLAGVFTSQIEGGKRYDLAVRGRERANATFLNSHQGDPANAIWLAMDLTPLLHDERMSVTQLVNAHLARFKNDVLHKLSVWESKGSV